MKTSANADEPFCLSVFTDAFIRKLLKRGIVTVYTLWIYCGAHIHGYYPHITLEKAMKHINDVLAWGNKGFSVELVPAEN